MQIKNLKNWLIILLMASMIALMLIVIKHYNSDSELQQKIYDHSEIRDTA
jgi:hypothetical protein